jgi:hypothetical protein
MTGIRYDVPVIVQHGGNMLPGRLSITRTPRGWDGCCYVNVTLWLEMEQPARRGAGDFSRLSHQDFLEHVRLVFGFTGGCRFEFVTDDFRPVPAEFQVDLEEIRRRLP